MELIDLFTAAERFIWANARVLEQRRFEYLFTDGDADAVVAALAPYRNADGGYGHALEPDLRGPVSQPVHVEFALRQLDEIGRSDTGVIGYLAGITRPDGGVPTVDPSIGDYPRPPYLPVEDDPPGSPLPMAEIVGLLHKHRANNPWLMPATEFIWRAVDTMTVTHPYEAEALVTFLDHVPDRARATRAAEHLGAMVRDQRLVVLDPADPPPPAPGYAPDELHFPHDYAPHPGSIARQWFSDAEMEASIDSLIRRQNDHGGWEPTFRRWSDAVWQEWLGITTIDALVTLARYGRLALAGQTRVCRTCGRAPG